MDSREQFEAWVAGRQVCKKYGAKLTKDRAGSYLDYRVNDRWLAWEASREAVVIELPGDTFGRTDYEQGRDAGIDDCRDAVTAAGLKVVC